VYARMLIFTSAILHFVPFLGRSISINSYRMFCISSIAMHLLNLFQKYGLPKFNMEYASRLLPDPSAMYLFLSVLLISSRPYLLAMAPLVLVELTHYTADICKYGQQNLPQMQSQLLPMIGKFFPGASNPAAALAEMFSPRSVSKINSQVLVAASIAEILEGIYLIVELILPSRNIMFLVLWWQYLQMRYMLDRSGNIKIAFSTVDQKIVQLLTNRLCPPSLFGFYRKLTDFLAKQAVPPTADGGGGGGISSMLRKCSIM